MRPESKSPVNENALGDQKIENCDEHLLVHKLRKDPIYIPELSCIAVLDGKVVGAILYSHATLQYGDIQQDDLTFGPLAVDSAAKDYGVGSILLETTIQLARTLIPLWALSYSQVLLQRLPIGMDARVDL